ncbi:MAG: hypothetical protein V2A54_10505 [Bacteroidota bacterium]
MNPRLLISFFLLLSLQGFGQEPPQYFNFSDTVFKVSAIHNLPAGTWWSWGGSPYPHNEDSLAVDFVSKNLNIKFEIVCHTDSRPIPMTTDTLSSRRAEYIMDDFLVKGVPFDQISSRGAAGHEPLILSKDTVIKYKQESFSFKKGTVLNDSFIYSLSSFEYREAAHSLNRRVELKIVKIMEPEFNLNGKVIAKDSLWSIEGAIIKLVRSDGVIEYDSTDSKGEYTFHNLPQNLSINILASHEGYYASKSKCVTPKGNSKKKEIVIDFSLIPIEKSVHPIPYQMFDYNSSEIKTDSCIAILLYWLKDNPEMVIEIIGFKDFNEKPKIAEKRMKAVKMYFTQNGIETDRLIVNSYSKKAPIIYFTSFGNPQKLLKHELTKEYILTLSTEDKEAAMKLSRTVMFKIVNTTYKSKKNENRCTPTK